MVVRDAVSLVLAGLAIGIPLALVSSRLVGRHASNVNPMDALRA